MTEREKEGRRDGPSFAPGQRTASIPVLALTAQAMHGDEERFLAAGFDGYISKPVNVVELLEVVRHHCERGTGAVAANDPAPDRGVE